MTENHAVERGGFTGELWRLTEDTYAGILAHPFLQGLTDGTLGEGRFRFYVLQVTFPAAKIRAFRKGASDLRATVRTDRHGEP